jgi:hypothetical protein
MEQITPREANSSSPIQEILQVFTTYNYMCLQHKISKQKILSLSLSLSVSLLFFPSPDLYDSVPNSPQFFPILSNTNLIYAIPSYFGNIYINIILPFMFRV